MPMPRTMRRNRAARRRYERRWERQSERDDAILLLLGGVAVSLFFAVAVWARWPEMLMEYLL